MPRPEDSPVNPLPPVVLALAVALITIEAILSLGAAGVVGGPGAIGWRSQAIADWGVAPAVLDWIVERRDLSPELLVRFLSYAFVHVSFTHALFAVVILLALGKFVGEGMGQVAVLVTFVAATVLGALVYCLALDGAAALVGAYPGVYGLIGAFTFMMLVRNRAMGESALSAFRLIGILLGLQFVFTVFFGAGPTWVADVTGFLVGLGLAPLVAPGGWAALLRRIRER